MIEQGDRVRVISRSSQYKGREGVATRAKHVAHGFWVDVLLDGKDWVLAFEDHELELIGHVSVPKRGDKVRITPKPEKHVVEGKVTWVGERSFQVDAGLYDIDEYEIEVLESAPEWFDGDVVLDERGVVWTRCNVGAWKSMDNRWLHSGTPVPPLTLIARDGKKV